MKINICQSKSDFTNFLILCFGSCLCKKHHKYLAIIVTNDSRILWPGKSRLSTQKNEIINHQFSPEKKKHENNNYVVVFFLFDPNFSIFPEMDCFIIYHPRQTPRNNSSVFQKALEKLIIEICHNSSSSRN